jgi:hypothetical protein
MTNDRAQDDMTKLTVAQRAAVLDAIAKAKTADGDCIAVELPNGDLILASAHVAGIRWRLEAQSPSAPMIIARGIAPWQNT